VPQASSGARNQSFIIQRRSALPAQRTLRSRASRVRYVRPQLGQTNCTWKWRSGFLLAIPPLMLRCDSDARAFSHHHMLDQQLGIVRKPRSTAPSLPLSRRDHFHVIVAADIHSLVFSADISSFKPQFLIGNVEMKIAVCFSIPNYSIAQLLIP